MQTRKRYLGPLAVVIGIAGCALLAFSRVPTPMVEAAHIVRPTISMNSAHSYLWLNDHTLFLYEEQSQIYWPSDAPEETGPGAPYRVIRNIDLVDTQTGRQRSIVCPPVPLQLPQQENTCDVYPSLQFFISPDRKQLLAVTDCGYSIVPASSVNQGAFTLPWRRQSVSPSRWREPSDSDCGQDVRSEYRDYPGDQVIAEDANHATWLPDGTWVTMHYSNSKLIYRIAGKDGLETARQTISLPAPVDLGSPMRAIGADAHGNMLMLFCPNIYDAPQEPAHLLEFAPGSPRKVSDTAVQLPAVKSTDFIEANLIDAALSPDGNRIAWLVPEDEKPLTRMHSWLLRFHLISPGPGPDTALWISDRRGRNLRRVQEWHNGDSELSSLQWCPDGSRVSFEATTLSANTAERDIKIDTIAVGK